MTRFRVVSSSFVVTLWILLQQPTTSWAKQSDPLNPYDNPTIGATLEHYDVDRTANTKSAFTCVDGGARCVFRRNHFTSISFGNGQNTEVYGEGAVWAATVAGAVLTLGNCNVTDFGDSARGACVVSCNANCTCAVASDDDNDNHTEPCTAVASRAPTPAPVDDSPAVSSPTTTTKSPCPNRVFEQFCGALMRGPGLPPGIEQNYDCYNFCGGVFVSSCDSSGQCGDTTCTNKTAAGTINGEVKGCTYQDYLSFTSATPTGGAFTSATTTSGARMTTRASALLHWITTLAVGGTAMLL